MLVPFAKNTRGYLKAGDLDPLLLTKKFDQ